MPRNGIRTGTGDKMMIPERFKTGETLKTDIGPKLNRLVDFVRSLVPHGDKSTILVRQTPSGCYFSQLVRKGGGSGGGSTDKKGPFYIEQKDATTITIYGNNPDADRNFKANIILGASIKEFAEQDLTITTSGYVLLHITYDNEWIIEALNQAVYTPDNNNQYIELGWVDVSGGTITNVIPYCSGSLSGEGGRVY